MTIAEQTLNAFRVEKKDIRFAHYYAGFHKGVIVQRHDWAIIYEFNDTSIVRVSDTEVEIIK